MRTFPCAACGIAFAIAAVASPTHATTTLDIDPATQPVAPAVVVPAPEIPVEAILPEDPYGIGQPLGTDALDAMRGGDGTTITNNVDLLGRVDGNTAEDIVSGMNVIQGGAFGSASGISTVIQNSGSNVLIQNGMVVNVQFVDPTP